ncbi:hypothetical protein P691DRAFT_687465, partial [Macrolepiota fuliginosa MF-IS2]
MGSGGSTPYPSVPHTPEASSDEGPIKSALPVVLSPVKCQQCQKNNSTKGQSDIEVWELDDEDFIEATFASLKSTAYDHFDITVECKLDDEKKP